MLLFLLSGCTMIDALRIEEPTPADCAERTLVYEDLDGDGYGKESVVALVCESRSGFVEQAGDCDDQDPAVWADCSGGGAEETGDTESGDSETGDSETGDSEADTDSADQNQDTCGMDSDSSVQ